MDLSTAALDPDRYPPDPWRLVETEFDVEDLDRTESLFSVANGYLGMRGNLEEGRDAHKHGTFVNGFHETWQINHAENAFGFARVGQTIVNVPDAKLIKLYVDDEPLLLSYGDLSRYERVLDFRTGVLQRDLVWRTPSGKRVRVRSRRMVSMTHRHLAVFTFEVTMLDAAAPVVISSQLLNRQDGQDEYHVRSAALGEGRPDPRQSRGFTHRVLEPQIQRCDGERAVLGYRCADSRMTLACGFHHLIRTDCELSVTTEASPDVAKTVTTVVAQPGHPITITKFAAYHSSRGVPAAELADRCERTMDRALAIGVEGLLAEQEQWFTDFWSRSDAEIEDRPALQQALRWNLFQLAQATGRTQEGVPAKGLTGDGYGGHFFWDTEIYVMPFLTYTSPEVARSLLHFRYRMLDHARRRAREVNQVGALYPWRTINGEEASAYYAAGTAQYHINADIMYALDQYVNASGDTEFLYREGAEMLVETARLWEDLGFYESSGRVFHIHGVTGPDEYTTVVNDNLFTNVMARFNLRFAAEVMERLAEIDGRTHRRLVKRVALGPDEIDGWRRAADALHVPYDESLGIHPQDVQFLERERWDLTADTKRPLLLYYHPLVIYRFQVLKQADVVLALFLQGDHFSLEEKRRDFEYYDRITTGDSSLSACVQSIVAAEVGYAGLALDYFLAALWVDLLDTHRNTGDGVHVASTGGVWSALVYGFAGLRDRGGVLRFDPRLPDAWTAICFRLTQRGHRLCVRVEHERMTFTLEVGDAVDVVVRGEPVRVEAGMPAVVPLEGQGPRLAERAGMGIDLPVT